MARAGLVAGDGDRGDRFGHWPARVTRAGAGELVLVPPRDSPLQVIDVDDLVRWLVTGTERRSAGTFNAVGDPSTLGAVLDASLAATGRSPRFAEASHG